MVITNKFFSEADLVVPCSRSLIYFLHRYNETPAQGDRNCIQRRIHSEMRTQATDRPRRWQQVPNARWKIWIDRSDILEINERCIHYR